MDVHDYLKRTAARVDSKLAPHIEDLRVLYVADASFNTMRKYLGDVHGVTVTVQSIWEFCKRHFSKETRPTKGDKNHSASPLEPPTVITSSPHQGATPFIRGAGEETGFTRTSGEQGSLPRQLQEQAPEQGPAELPSHESQGPFPNDASETPAFQPTPHGQAPNIEQSQPRARDASKLMAFLSAPAMPRRSETESQELDERSEALKAADRQQRREQPR